MSLGLYWNRVSGLAVLGLVTFLSGCALVGGEVGEPFPEERILE